MHSNVEPPNVAWKANDGAVTLVTPAGPSSIHVSGGEPSTTNNPEYAGDASTLPAKSVARMKTAYSTPPANGPRSNGDVHASK